jgi:hypothetical protein
MKSVEHFTEAISRLNEKKFFEISRNFLGDVKTPYHKQAIIERLISYLSNRESQEVMFSYITDDDALFINAIELIDDPSLHDIHAFFTAQFSYAECISLTTRLEERLIVYSYVDFGDECFAINPLFGGILERLKAKRNDLFPRIKKTEAKKAFVSAPVAFPVTKRFLFAFFSYIHSRKVQIKTDFSLTKKTEDEAAAFFLNNTFSELLKAAKNLGLVYISGNAYSVNMRALEIFLKMPEKQCRSYFAAGICADKECACLVTDFLASLSPELYYSSAAASRMIWIIFRKSKLNSVPFCGTFLAALRRTGLLIGMDNTDAGNFWYALPPDYTESDEPVQSESVPIVFDSSFSFAVLPNADIASIFDILYFSAVENMRDYRFVLGKNMVVRYFETCRAEAMEPMAGGTAETGAEAAASAGAISGGSAEWIIERLKTFAGGRIDETFAWTVREWEKRFGEVILHEGLVLYLGKERQYLAETAGLKPYLGRAIAENIFIIHPKHRETVEALLTKSGVDIIGGANLAPGTGEDKARLDHAGTSLPPLPDTSFHPQFFTGNQSENCSPYETTFVKSVDYRQTFRTMLMALDAADSEKQELLARIDRGLIFSGEQLKKLAIPGTFPYEKNEARGMDYSGKLLIAKSAYASRNTVEITWLVDGQERKLSGTIGDIEKKQSGDMLLVSADHENWEIPLGKISAIRKIKQSIFE